MRPYRCLKRGVKRWFFFFRKTRRWRNAGSVVWKAFGSRRFLRLTSKRRRYAPRRRPSGTPVVNAWRVETECQTTDRRRMLSDPANAPTNARVNTTRSSIGPCQKAGGTRTALNCRRPLRDARNWKRRGRRELVIIAGRFTGIGRGFSTARDVRDLCEHVTGHTPHCIPRLRSARHRPKRFPHRPSRTSFVFHRFRAYDRTDGNPKMCCWVPTRARHSFITPSSRRCARNGGDFNRVWMPNVYK